MLAEGGAVLVDVYSPQMFDAREESATYALNLLDGFWSPDDCFGFPNTFKYDEPRLLLDKYTIVERDRTRRVHSTDDSGSKRAPCLLDSGCGERASAEAQADRVLVPGPAGGV